MLVFIFKNEFNKIILTVPLENKNFMLSTLPRNMFGMRNINSDINSNKLFCSGVPVNNIL